MILRASVLVGLSALLAIACGGSVDGGGASSSGGAGSTSSSSGGSSGGSSSGGGTCTTAAVNGNRACVPGTARANAPITVDVDATDGCLGCFTKLEPCKVSVAGDRIVLAMSATTCPPQGDVACPAVCMIPSVKCTIPALAAGTYTVEVAGEGVRTNPSPRTLVVGDAGADSCTLLSPGTPPPPFDATKYGTSCSIDDDCTPARMGDPCKVCACPDTAIAKADAAKYQSDYRAGTSQCPSSGSSALSRGVRTDEGGLRDGRHVDHRHVQARARAALIARELGLEAVRVHDDESSTPVF